MPQWTAALPPKDGQTGSDPAGEGLAWTHWRFPAAVALITVGLCFFATFWLPGLLGDQTWLGLGDLSATVQSAQFVANGGLPWVYSVNVAFLPLPGMLVLLAPAVALGDHFNLNNAYPIALAHPSMWIVVTPVIFVTGATSILGVDYLADTLRVSQARRRIIAVTVALLVVLPTCCWAGHPEDLLCLGLSATALALILRQRHTGAAVILALAILTQPWAGLLVPLALVCAPSGARLRSLIYSCLAPGATALLLLATDFHDAYRSLVIQPMPSSHGQRLPWWSLAHQTRIVTDAGPALVRVGSVPRAIAVLIAVGAAVAIRRQLTPQRIIAVAALALLARGIFETQVWPYYLAPGAVFLIVGAGAFTARGSWRWPAGAVAALVFYGSLAGAYAREAFPSWLALAMLVLATAFGFWAGWSQRGLSTFAGIDEEMPALMTQFSEK